MRELAGRARAASAEGRLGALIEELERRGTYERRLAAVAAAAGGRTGHLAARLADPDPVVRHRALDTARRGGPGGPIAEPTRWGRPARTAPAPAVRRGHWCAPLVRPRTAHRARRTGRPDSGRAAPCSR
ncbi:hypothetical protein SANTM175S_00108 [Streptomyces antimycoticus]